jgi:hypothetical protein
VPCASGPSSGQRRIVSGFRSSAAAAGGLSDEMKKSANVIPNTL